MVLIKVLKLTRFQLPTSDLLSVSTAALGINPQLYNYKQIKKHLPNICLPRVEFI